MVNNIAGNAAMTARILATVVPIFLSLQICVGQGERKSENLEIFDHHVHVLSPQLIRDWKAIGMQFGREDDAYSNPENILSQNGLAHAFLISMAHLYTTEGLSVDGDRDAEQKRVASENDFVAECVSRNPDQLAGFFSVNPLREYWLDEAERCRANGVLLGMKLHFPACEVDLMNEQHLERVNDVFRWARDNEIPVLLHLFGAEVDGDPKAYARRFWRECIEPYVGLKLCLAHLGAAGGFNDVSSALLQEFELIQGSLREKHATEIFFDWSGAVLAEAMEGLPATSKDTRHNLVIQMKRIGLKHFLFASDYPVFSVEQQIENLRSLPWENDEWMKVIENRTGWCQQAKAEIGGELKERERPFGIQVVDRETGRGVPLIELQTVNGISYWTDSAGWAAVDEPALVGQEVFFYVEGHGYEFPADGFGMRGVRFVVQPGSVEKVEIDRVNIAERLYRITGSGIYRDSLLLGIESPIRKSELNAQVLGSDSVQSAVYDGRMFFFWGDTSWPRYPLGNFQVTGATASFPRDGGIDPATGMDLQYFEAASGFTKEMCPMPGEGPTWLEGLTVLGDGNSERMFAGYAKVKQGMQVYERGIVEWNPDKEVFENRLQLPADAPALPMGHSLIATAEGKRYVYFCHPMPWVRVPTTFEAIVDPKQYEVYTYLQDGSVDGNVKVDRGDDGQLEWRWRKNTARPTYKMEMELMKRGELRHEECGLLRDVAGADRKILLHCASIDWSDHLKRWVMIGIEVFGEPSNLGEIYYSEAEDLQGPWSPAVKIVTHDHYSFYNPRWHSFLSDGDSRYLYFEGTYTHTFSKSQTKTPRYDYNQIMYRLDLDDARLR
ncbi:MAG: amidohydrolase family protein [Pirellulaceae bacterium]